MKNGRIVEIQQKSRFIKEQKACGILSTLAIKMRLSKAPQVIQVIFCFKGIK